MKYQIWVGNQIVASIEAPFPRRAVYRYAQTQGSLGMLDGIWKTGPNAYQIRGTSGRTIDVTTSRIP